MRAESFVYWLQGFFEISRGATNLTEEQVDIIKNHLALVFKHDIDPKIPDPTGELQLIHDGLKPKPNSEPVYRC